MSDGFTYEKGIKQQKLTINVLFAALCFAKFMFGSLVFRDIVKAANDPIGIPFMYIAMTLSVVSLFMYTRRSELADKVVEDIQNNRPVGQGALNNLDLSNFSPREKKLITAIPRVSPNLIINWAVNEGVVIMGLLHVILNGGTKEEFTFFLVAGLGLNFLTRPQINLFIDRIESKIIR